MKVLITDHLHPLLAERLRAAGMDCDVEPDISNEEVMASLHAYQGLVVATKIRVTEALLDSAPDLQFVARAGSGMENIDQVAAGLRGISCVSSPEGNAGAVAEHAVGMLLALLNHLPRADREMRQGLFRREANRGTELFGKTLAIIGFGHTGSALAARLRGFGMTLLAHDKYKSGFSSGEWLECDWARIYREADIVSLHLPLTPETHYLINADCLARFEKPIYLVNTSRGPIVHTVDLIDGLQAGRVLGAALDVFENEKPDTFGPAEALWWEPLRAMEQVLLSPHVAGLTMESRFKIAEVLASKILALPPSVK
ncbi:MAG: hypothetical protein GC205_03030 [Bacteroidetes bacterium]|nr:hypothetical protein [Bacteroidota bacterium]